MVAMSILLFLPLMFLTLAAYHGVLAALWVDALSSIFARGSYPASALHIILLFLVPFVLTVAAAYLFRVGRSLGSLWRGFSITVLAIILPPLALETMMLLICIPMGNCM
jgi:hypothetical protein